MNNKKQAIALKSLTSATVGIQPVPRPVHGWLRAVRNLLNLSRREVGEKLGVTSSAVDAYEKSEQADTISLATMRRYAAAMNCEVALALVPRRGQTFSELVAAHDPEIAHLRATEHSMALEGQESGDLTEEIKTHLEA